MDFWLASWKRRDWVARVLWFPPAAEVTSHDEPIWWPMEADTLHSSATHGEGNEPDPERDE